MIDYILANNKYRISVKDVKVIPSEEIVSEHCLLLMDTVFKKKVRRKLKFSKKFKLWMWRELAVKEEFAEGVNNKWDGMVRLVCVLKRKLLDVTSEVCGYSKGKPSHFETWCWNKDVDVTVWRKRELFRIWKQSRNEEDKKYCQVKKDVKRVVYMAVDQKAQEMVEEVDSCCDGRELFRIAKQRLGRIKMLLRLVVLKINERRWK